MSKVWFTSDTHFGSERTLTLSKRPFVSVEEMDREMIKNWNETVDNDDIVYHLGDFGDYEKIKELNGNVVLLFGNYEHRDNISEEEFLNMGFQKVITTDKNKVIFYNIKNDTYNKERLELIMSHEPSNIRNNDRHSESFCVFGHIHKLQMVKRFGLNVGVDCHNFKPIDLDTILFYKNAIQNFYDEEVFIQETE